MCSTNMYANAVGCSTNPRNISVQEVSYDTTYQYYSHYLGWLLLYQCVFSCLLAPGTTLVSMSVFWTFNAFLLFLDITGRPTALLKYKIQEDKNVPVLMWRLLLLFVYIPHGTLLKVHCFQYNSLVCISSIRFDQMNIMQIFAKGNLGKKAVCIIA